MSKDFSKNKALKTQQSIIKKFKKTIWHRFIGGCKDYELIKSGDVIAVCISGGKDSFLLAKCMEQLQKHSDVPFKIKYLCMDPGYNAQNRKLIEENAKELGIDLHIFETNIFASVEGVQKSPCYLCARMRRGHLYKNARELGCNKIALGHHFDDVVETALMSMIWGAEIKTMPPKLHSTNYSGMELIRPLYLVRECDIKNWVTYNELEFLQCACRLTERNNNENVGARQTTKELVRHLRTLNPAADYNIFKSLHNVNLQMILGYTNSGTAHNFNENYNALPHKNEEDQMQNFIPGTPVAFEVCENFRELGGYKAKDGKTVKHGMIYRTGALALVKTEKDVETFKKLKIKTVIDFRSSVERKAQPDPEFDGVTNIPISALYDTNGEEVRFDLDEIFGAGRKGVDLMLKEVEDAYESLPFNNPAYKIMFEQICSGNTPVLFHCSAGKDRTGVAAALILRALCVSDEQILDDFDITNKLRPKSRAYFIEKYAQYLPGEDMEALTQSILGVDRKLLQRTLAAIDKKYENYEEFLLKECDVTKEMLKNMRSLLLF